MLLSYHELCGLVAENVITDVRHEAINAASIDIRLGNIVLVECDGDVLPTVDIKHRVAPYMRKVDITEGYYDLKPGEFILAHTIEKFNLPDDIAAEYKLKSSGARSGLDNALATWCDNGWSGSSLTLELKNITRHHTIRLHHGCFIGQMIFHRTAPVPKDRSYSVRGRYNNDTSVSGVKE